MKPILIDTHAHFNLEKEKKEAKDEVKRAQEAGIWLINSGTGRKSSQEAVDFAQSYKKGVYASVGLHPAAVSDTRKQASDLRAEEFDLEKFLPLAQNSKTVAIGEMGLEYREETSDELKEKQKEALMMQLDLARQINKPVIIHCRKGYDDLIEILAMFNFGCAHCPHACVAPLKGTIHSFMGSWTQGQKFLALGFHLSFNGVITYARDYDKVVQNTPLDRILLETDSPYLTPAPHRGEKNEPLYVKYVAEKIAEIKGLKFEEVARRTTENARALFGI